MNPAYLIDTNVIINGILNKNSVYSKILEAMCHGELKFSVSPYLLNEYRWALKNIGAMNKNNYLQKRAADVFFAIVNNGYMLERMCKHAPIHICPDPGDQFIWNLMDDHNDLILITSDKKLLKDREMHGRVYSPQYFLDNFHQNKFNKPINKDENEDIILLLIKSVKPKALNSANATNREPQFQRMHC